MSTSTRTFAAGLALLLLAGCTGGGGAEAATDRTTTTAVDAPEVDAGEGGNPFVQDLWIYERLRTVDARGEIVDHTERLVEAVSRFETAEAVELVPGMDFVPVPEVGAHLKGPDADPRADAGAVAGLVQNEIGTAFAVLGTVDPDGERQIGLDDRVFADMSFLGEAVGLDDVVSADLVLVQLTPTGDPAELELDAVDLAAHRAEAEALQFTADDDGDVVLLSGQLGRIVAGSEGPELPVKSWDDMADGFRGLRKCRSHALKCVSSFFDSFGDGATKNFDQNMDQLDPDPPDEPFNPLLHLPMEPPPPPCRHPPCGQAFGDPHLTTFDGHGYGMHAVGEFVLARHDDTDVEIQIRTSAVNDQVSQVDRVAVGIGDEVVIVGPDDMVAAGEVIGADRPATFEGADFDLTQLRGVTTIETTAGHVISLQRASRGHIDVVVAADAADGGWVGLLGDANGVGDDDLVTSDGRAFTTAISFEDLYEDFVTSWRLRDDISLFDYEDGEGTDAHTDLRYPMSPVSVDDLGDDERRLAEAVCRLVGVESPTVMDRCVIDFVITGDIDHLRSARLAQAVEVALQGGGGGEGGAPDSGARTAWSVSGEQLLGVGGELGTATHDCPPAPADETYSPWGDGIYHGGSSGVCAAAVHSGVLDAATGGTVTVTATEAEPGVTYEGVERNGISSHTWAGNSWGFVVES